MKNLHFDTKKYLHKSEYNTKKSLIIALNSSCTLLIERKCAPSRKAGAANNKNCKKNGSLKNSTWSEGNDDC